MEGGVPVVRVEGRESGQRGLLQGKPEMGLHKSEQINYKDFGSCIDDYVPHLHQPTGVEESLTGEPFLT